MNGNQYSGNGGESSRAGAGRGFTSASGNDPFDTGEEVDVNGFGPPAGQNAANRYNGQHASGGRGGLGGRGTRGGRGNRRSRQGASSGRSSTSTVVPPSTFPGVPERLTIYEFAYRRGRVDRDRGVSSVNGNFPPPRTANGFHEEWRSGHRAGLDSTREAFVPPQNSLGGGSAGNYTWAPLVNVYTQVPDNPNGSLDLKWVKDQCTQALDGMEVLLNKTFDNEERLHGPIVVDIPSPLVQALQRFPELAARYSRLQKDAAAPMVHNGFN